MNQALTVAIQGKDIGATALLKDVQRALDSARAAFREMGSAGKRAGVDASGGLKDAAAAAAAASQDFQEIGPALESVQKEVRTSDRVFRQFGAGVREIGSSTRDAMRDVARTVASSFDQLADKAEAFNARVSGFTVKLDAIGTAAGTLLLPFRGLAGALTTALSVVGSLTTAFGGLVAVAADVAATIGGAVFEAAQQAFGYLRTIGIGAVLGLAGALGLLVKRGLEVNLSLEKSERTFTSLFHSAAVARDFLAALRKEASTSAFEFVDLAGMSEALAAFGFQAQEIIPIMRTLGDAALGDLGKLQRLITAVGQIRAKGVMQGEEALQLTEAGIPVREILQLPVGVDFGDAKIAADQALPALFAGLNERFGGLQAAATTTLPGRLSNISDALNEIAASVTTGLLEKLRQAAGALLALLTSLERTAAGQALLRGLETAFNAVGDAALALVGQLPKVVEWIGAATAAIPWETLRDVAVNAFGLVRDAALKAGDWLRDNWPAIFETVKNIAVEALGIVGGVFAGLGRVIQAVAKDGGAGMAAFFGGIAKFIANLMPGLGLMVSLFARLGQAAVLAVAGMPFGKELLGGWENVWALLGMFGQVAEKAPIAAATASVALQSGTFEPIFRGLGAQGGLLGEFFGGFNQFRDEFRQRGFSDLMGRLTRPRPDLGGLTPAPAAPAVPSVADALAPLFAGRGVAASGYAPAPAMFRGAEPASQATVVPAVVPPTQTIVAPNVYAPVMLQVPPLDARYYAEVLRDPAFRAALTEFLANWLWQQQRLANPAPAWP